MLESSDPLLLRNVLWLLEIFLLLSEEFDREKDRSLPPLDERADPPDRSPLERSLPPPPPPPPPLPSFPSRSASAEPVETSSPRIAAIAVVRSKVVVRMIHVPPRVLEELPVFSIVLRSRMSLRAGNIASARRSVGLRSNDRRRTPTGPSFTNGPYRAICVPLLRK